MSYASKNDPIRTEFLPNRGFCTTHFVVRVAVAPHARCKGREAGPNIAVADLILEDTDIKMGSRSNIPLRTDFGMLVSFRRESIPAVVGHECHWQSTGQGIGFRSRIQNAFRMVGVDRQVVTNKR